MKKFLISYAMAVLIASFFFMALDYFEAASAPDIPICHSLNNYGEIWIELVMVIIGIPAVIYFIIWVTKQYNKGVD